MANYDIIGNIAIIKGEGKTRKEILSVAKELLKRPSIKTVVEKVDHFKGRLRTIDTKYLMGERNLVAEYKENDCVFKLDVEKAYFSSRLSGERKEVAKMVKKGDNVLVMFAGVGPYSVVIARSLLEKNPREEPGKLKGRVVSMELGKIPSKYAKENVMMNKVDKIVEVIQGDVKKQIPKLVSRKEKFDIIVMARPNLKDSFLKDALKVAKKNTKIIYYGFCRDTELKKMVEDLKIEAKSVKKKLKVLKIKEAGNIAPYKYRYRIDMKVL